MSQLFIMGKPIAKPRMREALATLGKKKEVPGWRCWGHDVSRWARTMESAYQFWLYAVTGEVDRSSK